MKTGSLLAAPLLAAAGVLAGIPGTATAECSSYQFGQKFDILQDDGWTVKVPVEGTRVRGGRASVQAFPNGDPSISNSLFGIGNGQIRGSDISFSVQWKNGWYSVYQGRVNPDGTASGYRETNGERIGWKTWGALPCA